MTTPERDSLILKYNAYHRDGKRVLTVTLSTYVKSNAVARSQMLDFWDSHFIRKVTKQLGPWQQNKIDYDFVIERSPNGNWHYHGLLALHADVGEKIWKNGVLNRQLRRDLESFGNQGKYRPFCVNEFLIEAIRDGTLPEHFIRYFFKTSDHLSQMRDDQLAHINTVSSNNTRARFNEHRRDGRVGIQLPKAA